jgi:hypothetical protein
MIADTVHRWHAVVAGAVEGLDDLLADDVVFHSPVVFTPQQGKALTTLYLTGALQVLGGAGFRYVKQVLDGDTAVLEFETAVDGTWINGVDIIRCDETDRIVELRVMLRPLKAINLVHERMGAMLEALKGLTPAGEH